MKVVQPTVELLWITPEPEKMIEIAGRTCYKSEDAITEESSAAFCRKMVISGHHAMIEHASASFKIITDKGITHEIVRHRIASYAQESTRYCNYSKDKFGKECSFIAPPGISKDEYVTWDRACRNAEFSYFKMLSEGASAQMARSVLPHCLKTEIVMTANLREWMHFIKLRSAAAAHPQIRPIAIDIYFILMEYAPNIFNNLI